MHQKNLYSKGFGVLDKVVNLLSEFCGWMSFSAVFGAMLIITYEVAARYIFKWPTYWEIEAAIFLLIIATFVGAAYTMKYDGHISLDIITQRMSPGIQDKLNFFTNLASLSFCLLASWRGWQMCWEAWELGWRSDSLWGPPLWIPYLFPAIGFTILSLQLIIKIVLKISTFEKESK